MQCTKCCTTLSVISLHSWMLSLKMAVAVSASNSYVVQIDHVNEQQNAGIEPLRLHTGHKSFNYRVQSM